jgi:hypothetical protein
MNAKGFSVGEIYKVGDRLEWIQNVLELQPAAPSPSADTDTPTPSNGNTNIPVPQIVPSLSPYNGAATAQPTTASAGTSTLAPPQPTITPAPSAPSVYYTLVNPTKLLPAATPEKIVNVTGQRRAPHAVAALLRILIEITAQEYLMRKQGFYYDSSNNFRNPADPGRTYKELQVKLNYIANQCGLPGNIAQVLRTLLGQQLMTAELNQVVHSTIFTADAASIKGLWKNFENVFDHLISEIQ